MGDARALPGGIRREFLRELQPGILATRRSGFTLMACVAGDAAIQLLLPQIIHASKAVLMRLVLLALGGPVRADSVCPWRRKSSLVNVVTLACVELVAQQLEPVAQQRHALRTLEV